MRWYAYEIEVPPKSTITNSLVAPIYPTIHYGGGYEYEYLLSTAQQWEGIESLEIIINTPYNIALESLDGFEKTETGYHLLLQSFPQGEFEFYLFEST